MIRPILIGLIAAAFVARSGFAAQNVEPEVVDGVAAVVNGDVITYSQVRSLVGPREKLLRAQYSGEELVKRVKEAREAGLRELIDRQVVIQAIKKENLEVPAHFIQDRMHDIIRTDCGGDRNTFLKPLE